MGHGSKMQILILSTQDTDVKIIGSEPQAMRYGSKMLDSHHPAQDTVVNMRRI